MTAMDVVCYCNATAPALKRSMRRAGIARSVVCNIASKLGQTESVLSFALEIMRQEGPELIPFAGIHPFEADWKEYLGRIKALGFRGIKLHPDYQSFFVDDPRLEPFYNEIARLGLICVLHAGLDLSMPKETHAPTERIYNVLPLLEKGTTVLAHMGGYSMERKTYELLCGRNVYFDTSFNLMELDPDMAGKIFRKHGPERILYGTDSPWRDQKQSVEYFRDSFARKFLSHEDTQRVLWHNAAALLGL